MLTAAQLALSETGKRYGDRIVPDRASLSIRPGGTVGVAGGNGSANPPCRSCSLRENGPITVR